jgi:hypothetical protein
VPRFLEPLLQPVADRYLARVDVLPDVDGAEQAPELCLSLFFLPRTVLYLMTRCPVFARGQCRTSGASWTCRGAGCIRCSLVLLLVEAIGERTEIAATLPHAVGTPADRLGRIPSRGGMKRMVARKFE